MNVDRQAIKEKVVKYYNSIPCCDDVLDRKLSMEAGGLLEDCLHCQIMNGRCHLKREGFNEFGCLVFQVIKSRLF